MQLNNSTLHHYILQHIIDYGRAPRITEISEHFSLDSTKVVGALQALQDYHGVVLHPRSSEVWVIHPFATAPTNFWIQSKDGSWWGNCAWCSLGAAALLNRDLTITTNLGGESQQIVIEIKGGQLIHKDLYIHFPIPMINAWDNVIYTCSTMLMFQSEADVSDWCRRHGIPIGDVQPIQNIWKFSKVWYGNHLNPQWEKWSVNQACQIFEQFGLANKIWQMPKSSGRF